MSQTLNVELPGRVTAVSASGAARAASAPVVAAPQAPAAAAIDETAAREILARVEQDRQALRQAAQALEVAAARVRKFQDDLLANAEVQLLDLAVEIARKVLMQEIQAGRYEIEPIVKEALLRVPARQDVIVRLNPDDYLRCQMVQQTESSAQAGMVRFVSDPGVRRAECILETAQGVVDSSPEAHLEAVVGALNAVE